MKACFSAPFSLKSHRSLLYCEGVFSKKARATNPLRPKTADGILRYAEYPIVGIIDSTRRTGEKIAQDILDNYVAGTKNASVPVFKTLREAIAKTRADVLILGSAPEGGELPKSWRKDILHALQKGMDIVSGMHYALNADKQFAAAAKKSKAKIWDARLWDGKDTIPVASLRAYHMKKPIVLTVGTDAAIGKMTVTYELARAARELGLNAEGVGRTGRRRVLGKKAMVIPTGQTSIMIEGWGVSIDALPADFMAGGVEEMIMQKAGDADALFVEGQGSLFHPAYANTCISLLHGACPTHLVLVHRPMRKHSIGSKLVPLPSLKEAIALYEKSILPPYRNTKVIAIALNTANMSKEEAEKAKKEARRETKLPVGDVVQDKDFAREVIKKIFA